MANYKCGVSGCYSYQSPETNAGIRELQKQINRFSLDQGGGFSPIGVDGVVGNGTLTALFWALKVISLSDQVGPNQPSQASMWISALNKPDDVMRGAPYEGALSELPGFLREAADKLGAPEMVAASTTAKPNTIPQPTSASSASILASLQASKPATNASFFNTLRDLPPWAMWGGGMAGVGGFLFLFTHSKKKSKRLTAG